MSKKNLGVKALSLMLVLMMLMSVCAPTIGAAVSTTEDSHINYVSIGDSMTNGYGFEGYYQGNKTTDQYDFMTGEGVYGADAYPLQFEKYLEGKIELNQSAYMGDELRLSMIERPISKEGMLTFWDKYGGDVKSMSGSMREMPANIDAKLSSKINALTAKVYKALDLKGIVRIDYLYTEEGGIYLNEINTIPGSMALYLYGDRETWSDILGETVRYAYAYKLRKDAVTRDFGCDLIHSHSKGVKNS